MKQEADVEVDEPVGRSGYRRLRSRSKNVERLLREFSLHPDVLYAEPNYVIRVEAIPNDPQFSELYGLNNASRPGTDIKAVAAWDITTGSRNQTIAVIDTGIDYNHPDLVANLWSAPAAFTVNIGGQTIRCEAGTRGFNAVTKTCDPMDDHGHGTHVAGTIGAVGNNAVGVTGVNWSASMMAIKIFDATGRGTTADAINGIEFAIQAKAAFPNGGTDVRVLNNSWGGGGSSMSLLDAINRAHSRDMLFVAAAGNNSSNNDVTPYYPAGYNAPNVIAVAATDGADNRAYFSNYGVNTVHLGAPGHGILSTTPNNTYDYYSGTSMATPHVAGAAALILSRCAVNTSALKTVILNNVDVIPSLSGSTITGGRLNVERALRSCAPLPSPTPTPTPTPPPPPQSFLVGGLVTSGATPLAGYRMIIFDAGGDPLGSTLADNAGQYRFEVNLNQQVIIRPSSSAQHTFTPVQYAFTAAGPRTDLNFTSGGAPTPTPVPTPTPTPTPPPTPSPTPAPTPTPPPPPQSFLVGGLVTSGAIPLAGYRVLVYDRAGDAIGSTLTDGAGQYRFEVNLNQQVIIRPSSSGQYTFAPVQYAFTAAGPRTDLNFTSGGATAALMFTSSFPIREVQLFKALDEAGWINGAVYDWPLSNYVELLKPYRQQPRDVTEFVGPQHRLAIQHRAV